MSSKSIMSNGSGGSFRQSSLHEKLHYTSSGEEKVKLAGDESKDRMYEPKRDKKMMRVVTVVIYVFSVSLAAIMLSLYYVFFWHPTGPHYVTHHAAAAHAPANVTTTTPAVARSCLHGTEESTDPTVVLNEEVAYSQYPVNLLYDDDTGSTEMTTDTTLTSDPSTEMSSDPITAPTKLSRILGIKRSRGETNNMPKQNE